VWAAFNAKVDTPNPLAYGVAADLAIRSEHRTAWDTQLPVVARYPDSALLASDWLVGERIRPHGAVRDAAAVPRRAT
jgi:hypothetical protein